MIKIKSLSISNYRSCAKTKFDVLTNLTTLIGVNGAGKSNILNGIQLLKRINGYKDVIPKEFLDSFPYSLIELMLDINNEEYNLQSDIYYNTNGKNTEELFLAKLKIKKNNTDSKWLEIAPGLFKFIDYIHRKEIKLEQIEIDDMFKEGESKDEKNLILDVVSYLSTISYYSATQFSDPTKCPISLEIEEFRLARSDKKEKTHEQFIYDLYKSYKLEKKKFKKYINTVNKNGIGLIDDIIFRELKTPNSSLRWMPGGKVQKIEREKNIIIPFMLIGDLNLSPNQLSEGTFKTLALIFYILNDESNLVLIEEPEVCVHHGLLDSIIELIKSQSKHKQFFISTHSDYVLDKLEPENIVLVKMTTEGTTADSLPQYLSKNDFDEALKEYLKESGNLGEYWKEGGFDNE